ncbi:nitronate monooxygenase [Pseudonocardia sp. H11422]|uniref:nitronate monooxygenase n=1 Tax=Pseudonocardia sp. H11422 TaxID=2835866 RepID=UPI001BDDB14D|nr:nitronate monooxygenase [Pseudonocardia sp. H11422]
MLDALAVPVVAAPMAGGGTTPELVAAVGAAGGFGFLAGGYLDAAALADRITALRALSDRPFGVNLFVPGPRRDAGVAEYRERLVAAGLEPGEPRHDDDGYPAKVALLLAEPVPLVSFTFGCPDAATVRGLHAVGSEVVVTVTGPAEARVAARAGADALVVQGMEAGAHRGLFLDDATHPAGGEALGVLAVLRLVAAAVDLPLVAAGGIADGAGVAAVLAAGAVAAQLGTAFLLCPEAGTKAMHRAALSAPDGPGTEFTRAFTGRIARGIRNPFLDEHTAAAPAAYPQVHHITARIRAQGDADRMALWAGQAYPLARALPAAALVALLRDEAAAAAAVLADRIRTRI